MGRARDALTPEIRFHLVRRMERHKIMALAGPRLLPHERKYLEFHKVSGIVLFQRNVESLSQVGELIAAVTEELSGDGIPPLVMADHEGDFVAELRQIIGVPPALLAVAATRDLDLAGEVAYETGAAMRKLGVNTVLAPVADCYFDATSPITGLRTFGKDPERVAAFVERTVEGFRAAGVLACAKHFPGHGSTPEDSHETLPEVRKSADELAAADLVPFRRAIEAGVDLIMMSHVAYPMGTSDLVPASFDSRIVRTMLRGQLGFGGVVITDALEMAGARSYASDRSGAVTGGFERSLLAGSDLLLHTRPIPEQLQVEGGSEAVMSLDVMETIVRTLEKIVDRGRIDEKLAEAAAENEPLKNILSILDASFARVGSLRQRAADPRAPSRPAAGGKVIELTAYPSVPAVYRTAAEQSVTGWSDWSSFEPLPAGSSCVVVPIEWAPSESLKRQDLAGFLDVLCRHFPRWQRAPLVTGFEVDADGRPRPQVQRERTTVVDAARYAGGGFSRDFEGDDVVLVFSARGTPSEEFAAGLQAFAEAYAPVVVVLTGWPVRDWVPEGTPVLLSLGASSHVASVVAQILAGAHVPQGSVDGLLPT